VTTTLNDGSLAEAELQRAQLVDVSRQLCDLIARRTSLARQLLALPVGTTGFRRPDHARELRTVARFGARFGEEGRTLGLLVVRLARGDADPAIAGPGLVARISCPADIDDVADTGARA
jgi:hypothetical protein